MSATMYFDVNVPHKDMSEERKVEVNSIMVVGNSAYHRWMSYISNRRSRVCRQAIIDGDYKKVLSLIPEERHPEFMADIPAILAVETVIEDVIAAHVKMVVRLARRWADANSSPNLAVKRSYFDGDDLVSEGFLAMYDVIRNYDRANIRFLTYAWNTVNRRMFAALMETAPIACFNRREQNLLKKVIKSQLAAGRKQSLAEAVSQGVIGENDVGVVRQILAVEIVLASTLEKAFGAGMGEDEVFGYISLRADAHTARPDSSDSGAWEFYDLLQRAGLSEIEEDALISCMNPVHGWMTQCAKRHKNSDSGRAVSKMAVTYALQRAITKVRRVAGLPPDTEIDLPSLMAKANKASGEGD
jgi:hypothetical protein